jgi:hypothetical protein
VVLVGGDKLRDDENDNEVGGEEDVCELVNVDAWGTIDSGSLLVAIYQPWKQCCEDCEVWYVERSTDMSGCG